MGKRGRPSKYETDVKSRFEEIKQWLEIGATDKEISENLGIHKATFVEYKKQFNELNDLIKNGRKTPVIKIKQAMLKRALGFQYEEKKVITQKVDFNPFMAAALEKVGIDTSDEKNKPLLIKTETTTKTALPSEAAGLILLQHWDLDEKGKTKWSRDLASREIKKAELELKKKQAEKDSW